jgi:hypothetical protein
MSSLLRGMCGTAAAGPLADPGSLRECRRLMLALPGQTLVVLSGLFLAIPLAFGGGSSGAPFAGAWTLNAAKTQAADGRFNAITIEESGDHLKVESTARKGDSVVKTQFACTTNGKDCDFDEAGHKSKVSMWYNGTALVIMKTDGPESDSASQWKLEVASDGKTLTLTLSHILPAGNDEVFAFDKK